MSQGAGNKKEHFSLKEWSDTGTGCPGVPKSAGVQEASGCDFEVMVVVLGWLLDLLISSSLNDSVGCMELAQLVLLTLPIMNCSGKFKINSHLIWFLQCPSGVIQSVLPMHACSREGQGVRGLLVTTACSQELPQCRGNKMQLSVLVTGVSLTMR